MERAQAEDMMDPVVRAFIEFLLDIRRQAVKDGHEFRDAFTVDPEFLSGHNGIFIWVDFQVCFDV